MKQFKTKITLCLHVEAWAGFAMTHYYYYDFKTKITFCPYVIEFKTKITLCQYVEGWAGFMMTPLGENYTFTS